MYLRPEFRRLVALGLIMLLPAAGLHALPDDRLQAIEITAERAERNEPRGYTLYSGAVILTQGSLRIEADSLTIFHDRVAADRIIARGEPARLRQRPAPDKPFVTASAQSIVYEKSRELVLLRVDARIEQDGAIVTGQSIEYFMAEQRVRADAAASDDSSRVQVFIPADVVEAASQDDPEDPDGNERAAPRAGDAEVEAADDPEGKAEKDKAGEARGGTGGT